MKPASLPAVSILNRQRRWKVDRAKLWAFAQLALSFCLRETGQGLTNLEELNVVLISDRRMAEVHRRFMGIGEPTDVITFQHGEILISVETAWRQSKIYRTSLEHELRLYLVHGLLHLRGLDDAKPAGRARMKRIQESILARAVISHKDRKGGPGNVRG
jgi:probable rRNA maturation factor